MQTTVLQMKVKHVICPCLLGHATTKINIKVLKNGPDM